MRILKVFVVMCQIAVPAKPHCKSAQIGELAYSGPISWDCAGQAAVIMEEMGNSKPDWHVASSYCIDVPQD